MQTCIYCNEDGHNGEACPEKELEEGVGNVQEMLHRASLLPFHELSDGSKAKETCQLYARSIFSQYLLFSSFTLLKQKESKKSASTTPSISPEATGFYKRGKALFADGLPAEAIRCFKNAIEADPEYFEPIMGLAFCCLEKGKFKEAAARLQDALELATPKKIHSYILLLLARISHCSGNKGDAKSLSAEALKTDHTFFLPYYYLAILYKDSPKQAVNYLEQVEQKNIAAFAGFFLDKESLPIPEELTRLFADKLEKKQKKARQYIKEAEKQKAEAKKNEGEMYAPHNFKTASLKIRKAKIDNDTLSFYAIGESLRNAEDAILYLDTVKSLTKTRKSLTKRAMESFRKNTARVSVLSGLLVSGWAFILGGFAGVTKYAFSESASPVIILYWGFGISILSFLILQVNCLLLFLHSKKKFFKKYVESFHSKKMDEHIEKEHAISGSKKIKKEKDLSLF